MCFLFAITLPFDIRDYDIDRSDGIKTIPHLIGKKGTVLLIAFLMLSYIFIMYQSSEQVIGYNCNIGDAEFNFHFIYSMLIIFLGYLSLKKRSEYFYLVYIDGACLLPILGLSF